MSTDILLHESGHIQLSDFDLSKQSDSSAPAVMKQITPHGAMLVDTKSCVADFRTNSFVGTEEYIAPEVIKGCGHSSAVDWWTTGILIYEMLYGSTPFKGSSRQLTFSNVLRKDPQFSDHPPVSTVGKACVKKLLCKNEHQRLGSQTGASEVKSHKWFASVSWGLLRHARPPIVPLASVSEMTLVLITIKFTRMINTHRMELTPSIFAPSGIQNPLIWIVKSGPMPVRIIQGKMKTIPLLIFSVNSTL